jgi:cell wall-associated NlpC family hydrolase
VGIQVTPYFADDKVWTKFLDIAMAWEGTPYRHCTMAKGRGADCTLFIGACWLEAGILKRVTWDYYPKDWHLHTNDERVLDGLYRHFRGHAVEGFSIERMPEETEEMRGDLLTFTLTQRKVTNHSALYLGEVNGSGKQIMHCINGRGVILFPYHGFFSSKKNNVFRIMRS